MFSLKPRFSLPMFRNFLHKFNWFLIYHWEVEFTRNRTFHGRDWKWPCVNENSNSYTYTATGFSHEHRDKRRKMDMPNKKGSSICFLRIGFHRCLEFRDHFSQRAYVSIFNPSFSECRLMACCIVVTSEPIAWLKIEWWALANLIIRPERSEGKKDYSKILYERNRRLWQTLWGRKKMSPLLFDMGSNHWFQ